MCLVSVWHVLSSETGGSGAAGRASKVERASGLRGGQNQTSATGEGESPLTSTIACGLVFFPSFVGSFEIVG